MKSNIVLLGTYLSRATGIMYPCNYDKAEGNQSYIILTCAHLFDEMENMPQNGEDIKKYLNIQIYDDDGEMVTEDEIIGIRYHIPKLENRSFCDVAALLVLIRPHRRISLDTIIYSEELENRTALYIEGYPVVMLEDEVNQKIQLMGLSKQMFPDREELGMYQIEDEYHWYNNYLDKKLLEGFSGSPVYMKKDNRTVILGMNESVVNISDGENPFKIVYYLKFPYILKLLRESKCILFVPEQDGSVQIDWIYDLKDELKKAEKKELTLLMLGDSGAGKSSFAQTFSYHSDNLMATSDGQTTRTNIAYRFELLCNDNLAKVHFMSESRFTEKMNERNGLKGWNIFFREVAGLKCISIEDDGNTFLENTYEALEENNKHLLLKNLLDEEYGKGKAEIYEKIMESFIKYIEIGQFTYLFDRVKLKKWYLEVKSKQSKMHSHKKREKDILNDLSGKEVEKAAPEVFDIFLKSIGSIDKRINWGEFYQKIKEKYCPVDSTEEIEQKTAENQKMIYEGLCSDTFLRKYTEGLLKVEGFFDIEEFGFGINEISEAVIRKINEYQEKKAEQKNEKTCDKILDFEKFKIDRYLNEISHIIYRTTYHVITERIKEDFGETLKNKGKTAADGAFVAEFNLNTIRPDEKEKLAKCLKVFKNRSYTGIIQSVEIVDEISDNYALLLKRMNIRRLTLLDTCGLNHVEDNMTSLERVRNIITEYRDADISFEEAAVLYIKKLDAGRPDELRNILPVIVRALPKAPVYCVFTGIDIFYGNYKKHIFNIEWEKEKRENLPKPVKFVLQQNYEELLKYVDMSTLRKRHFGMIIKNNLIAFCGNKELVEKEYDVFCSNLKNVKKLLASIAFNEYASLNIANVDLIKEKLREEDGKKQMKRLVRLIFEYASIKNFEEIHHMVIKANYIRLCDKKRDCLGHWGACRYRWSQLFHDAYDDVIVGENQSFLDLFEENEKMSVEGALLRMADKYFLGNDNMLFDKNISDEKKNEFRKTLEEMYQEGKYIYNPFKSESEDIDFRTIESKEAIKYLKDILDFEKGLENESTLEKFCDCFYSALINQIEEDNKSKPETLINIHEDLHKAIDDLGNLFEKKFDDRQYAYRILMQYLQDKLQQKSKENSQ